MKELFDNKQDVLLFCNSGKVYIHYNEKEVMVTENVQVGEDEFEEVEVTKWEYDVVKISCDGKDEESVLSVLKAELVSEIDAYDKSIDVNSFILNGEVMWLPKSDRVGLMNSVQIEKGAGREQSTMWFGGIPYTINCDVILGLLQQLELYALDCYNVTAQHKHRAESFTDVEGLLNYKDAKEYSQGYPSKLDVTL